MNPFEMVAIIVVSVMIASVLRGKYSHRRRDSAEDPPEGRAENLRLREEVQELKERIKSSSESPSKREKPSPGRSRIARSVGLTSLEGRRDRS